MKAGMYPQAIEMLKKRINNKPSDGEAHFQLGICYILTNDFTKADERFASAVQITIDYGFQIADEYKKVGINNMQSGHIVPADKLFKKAFKYKTNLRKDIAKKVFDGGKAILSQKGNAIPYFDMAVKYDSTWADKACEVFYNAGMSSSGMEKINYLEQAMQYCSKYNGEIKSILCKIYFDMGKSTSPESSIGNFTQARQYCNKYNHQINQLLLAGVEKINNENKFKEYLKNISNILSKEELFEATIKYYTKLKGKPQKIVLNNNKWVEVSQVYNKDQICHFSLHNFLGKCGDELDTFKAKMEWPRSHCLYYYGLKKSGETLDFKEKDGKPTTVYVWIIKK